MAAVRTPEPAPRSLAARLLAARADDRPPSRWRGRLTAGLAGAAVGVTGLAALIAVAAGAQPGDPLYDLKRGTEQTQLALAGDSRGQTLLELASTRLDELRSVAGDAELVRQTLQTMDQHTVEGAALLTARAVADRDTATLGDLADWSGRQSSALASLRSRLPAPAEPAYLESTDLLEALTTRTAGLSLALDCASGPATVGTDALGPVPGLCLTEPAPPAPQAPAPGQGQTPGAPAPGTPSDVAATPTPAPPAPPAAVPGTGTGPGAVPPAPVPTGNPGTPKPPSVGGLLPTPSPLPIPGTTGTVPTRPATPPVLDVPLEGPIRICLPPLATIGNC
nr:DUF5667 domain-containing protein [Blastococcus saxobsidens]